jgi:hypothetical protein
VCVRTGASKRGGFGRPPEARNKYFHSVPTAQLRRRQFVFENDGRGISQNESGVIRCQLIGGPEGGFLCIYRVLKTHFQGFLGDFKKKIQNSQNRPEEVNFSTLGGVNFPLFRGS